MHRFRLLLAALVSLGGCRAALTPAPLTSLGAQVNPGEARIVLPQALLAAPPESLYWTVSWEPSGRYGAQSPGAAGLGIAAGASGPAKRPLDERLRRARRLYWETGSAGSLPVVYEHPEPALRVALRDSVVVLQLGPCVALSQLRRWRPDSLRLDLHRWTVRGPPAAWIPVTYAP